MKLLMNTRMSGEDELIAAMGANLIAMPDPRVPDSVDMLRNLGIGLFNLLKHGGGIVRYKRGVDDVGRCTPVFVRGDPCRTVYFCLTKVSVFDGWSELMRRSKSDEGRAQLIDQAFARQEHLSGAEVSPVMAARWGKWLRETMARSDGPIAVGSFTYIPSVFDPS